MSIQLLSKSPVFWPKVSMKSLLASIPSKSRWVNSLIIGNPPVHCAARPSFLRPFSSAVNLYSAFSCHGSTLRTFSTRAVSSSLNDSNPNWSNRPPKETILLDGCDFEHWLVVMEKPEGDPTRDEIIDSYIKTLAMVVGSEEEARMKIYSVSTRCYYAFGALVSEELSYKLKELPRVRWVLPDSYLNVKEKDYGGEPFINGQAVPYDPKYHEEWERNNQRAMERNRRNDRPRNNDRSRNFNRSRNMPYQNPQPQMGNSPPSHGGFQQQNAAPIQATSPPNHGGFQPQNPAPNQASYQPSMAPNQHGSFPQNNSMPPNQGGYPQSNMMPPNQGGYTQSNMMPPSQGGYPQNNMMQPNRGTQGGYPHNNMMPPNQGAYSQNNMMPPWQGGPPQQGGYQQNNPPPPNNYNVHQNFQNAPAGTGMPPSNSSWSSNAPGNMINQNAPPGGRQNYQDSFSPERD